MFPISVMQHLFDSCWIELVSMLALALVFLYINRGPSYHPKDDKDAMRLGKKMGKKSKASTRSTASTDIGSEPALASISGSDEDAITSGSRAQRALNMRTRTPGRRATEISSQRNRSAHGKEKDFDVETTPTGPNKQFVERLRDVTSRGDAPPDLEELLKRRLQREESGHSKTIAHSGLQQVLSKLTPEDAAIVKAAFSRSGTDSRFPDSRILRDANITPENTLRSNLRKLSNIDSKRVFMVRKIAKLGLNSPELLKAYFSKFGKVEEVYITHGLDKRTVDGELREQPVVRPAGIGFVVMETADDVVNIFKQGLEHTVSGVAIALTAYEHHTPEEVMRNESKFGRPPSKEDTNSKPRFPSYANITEDNTLRANLRKMADIDASRIFMVRKMNKLGLGSAQLLKTHFGQFGGVTNVFVTHSIDRRKERQEHPHARPMVRPAGIGFVVMDEADDVAKIFQHGLEHDLYGVKICVAPYEHQVPDEASLPDNEHECPILEETGSNDRELESQVNEELDC